MIFKKLDKDGDQKLSPEEFVAGMKLFHTPAMAGRGPKMGRGPMSAHPFVGRPPMAGRGPLGPHPGMGRPPLAGRGAMLGRGPRGPHPGMGPAPWMGRAPWMGARAAWGRSAWARSPWARQAWAGAVGRRPAMGGAGAAWAKQQGPMAGHGAAILGRLQAADKDKDGKLSKSEATGRLQQQFGAIDANKDGQLDKAELAKAFHAFGRKAREAMAKDRGEAAKRAHDARDKAAEKRHALKKEMAKKPAEPKKHIDKKVKEKKPEEKKG